MIDDTKLKVGSLIIRKHSVECVTSIGKYFGGGCTWARSKRLWFTPKDRAVDCYVKNAATGDFYVCNVEKVLDLCDDDLVEIKRELLSFKQAVKIASINSPDELKQLYTSSQLPCLVSKYAGVLDLGKEVKSMLFPWITYMPKFKRLKLPESSWYEFVANFSKVEK